MSDKPLHEQKVIAYPQDGWDTDAQIGKNQAVLDAKLDWLIEQQARDRAVMRMLVDRSAECHEEILARLPLKVPDPPQFGAVGQQLQVPMCAKCHKRPAVLRIYSRGPSDPPGNGWGWCDECSRTGLETAPSNDPGIVTATELSIRTEPACQNCGHINPHNGPAGSVADACTHPGCKCGFDSRGDTCKGVTKKA